MTSLFAMQHAVLCKDDTCLIWPFARDTHGRGQIFWQGKRRQVHPLVCEAVRGPRPTPKHEVSHSCHNGRGGCVNGRHLSWATRKENVALQPGKMRFGRKLTAEQVKLIRFWLTYDCSARRTANFFGVDESTIRQIKAGERWWWLS